MVSAKGSRDLSHGRHVRIVVSSQVRYVREFLAQALDRVLVHTQELNEGYLLPLCTKQRFQVDATAGRVRAMQDLLWLCWVPPENQAVVQVGYAF